MKYKKICLLLLLLIICLSACSSKETTVKSGDEHVKLSNILFVGDEMSAEQEKILQKTEEMLRDAVLMDGNMLNMKNTSGEELSVSFYVVCYDREGVCKFQGSRYFGSWAPDVELSVSVPNLYDVYDEAEVAAEIQYDGTYLRTNYVPLSVKFSADVDCSSQTGELPVRVSYGDRSFVLTNIQVIRQVGDGSKYTLEYEIINESKQDIDNHYAIAPVTFKITENSTGAVAYSGEFDNCAILCPGEILRKTVSIELEPGEYAFEIECDSLEKVDPATLQDLVAEEPEPTNVAEPTEKEPSGALNKPMVDYAPRDSSGWDEAVKESDRLVEKGEYYEAAVKLTTYYADHPECEDDYLDWMVQLKAELKAIEPETGELERTFQYNGGHLVEVTAASGPIEMTITDVSDRSKFVHFYVRRYETSNIPMMSGEYEVTFKIGSIWFGDDIGFGDLCSEHSYDDTLVFKTEQTVGWITNQRWAPVL